MSLVFVSFISIFGSSYEHILRERNLAFWFGFFGLVYVFSFLLFRNVVYQYLINNFNQVYNQSLTQPQHSNDHITRNRGNSVTSKNCDKLVSPQQSGTKQENEQEKELFSKTLFDNEFYHSQCKQSSNKLVAFVNAILTLYRGFTIMKLYNLTESQVQNGCDTLNNPAFDDIIDLTMGYTLIDTVYMALYDRTKRS